MKIAEDPMCPLCGEEYDTIVYTFLEDAVLSLNKEENSLETISYFQVK